MFVSDNTKNCYHPGRSGSITLKSEKGPHLAYFGELHPGIIKNGNVIYVAHKLDEMYYKHGAYLHRDLFKNCLITSSLDI